MINKIFLLLKFYKDFFNFMYLSDRRDRRFKISWFDRFPFLYDRTSNTSFDRHYIYFPVWAFQKILKYKPNHHIDISSTLSFSTMLSQHVKTTFYDLRPAQIKLPNYISKKADLTNLKIKSNSISSLSCMHVIEHIGLGRYGDVIDPLADIKAARELVRVLAIKGNLLIVVPIGAPRVYFNAHKVYSYNQVINLFHGLELLEFSYISGKNDLGIITNPKLSNLNGETYACGCFWFTKK